MTTVINNPSGGDGSGSGMGVILGVLIAIVVIVLFFVYGLPRLRGNQPAQNRGVDINLTVPSGSNSTPPGGGAAN